MFECLTTCAKLFLFVNIGFVLSDHFTDAFSFLEKKKKFPLFYFLRPERTSGTSFINQMDTLYKKFKGSLSKFIL